MKKKIRSVTAALCALSAVCAFSACNSGSSISDSQAESVANNIIDSIDWGGLTGSGETTAAPVDPKTVDYSKVDVTVTYGDSSTISEIGSNMWYGNYDGKVIKIDGLSCKYGSKYSIMERDSDSSKTGFDYELIDSTDYPADGARVELTGVISSTGDEWGTRRLYVLPANVRVIALDAGDTEAPGTDAAETTTTAAEAETEATTLEIAPNNEDAWEVTKADEQPTETTSETTAAEITTAETTAVISPAPAKEPEIKTDAKDNKYAEVVFDKLPTTYEEFIALPQANLSNVYDTAAMTVLALSYYPTDPDLSMKMYEFISGPRTINAVEYSFIKDRFMDYDYVPRSYFSGSTPANDYTPSEPYTVKVSENPYTYADDGYAKMYLTSGGSDNDRFVMLRKAKDGKWYLWEQFILVGIREPESSNPWA